METFYDDSMKLRSGEGKIDKEEELFHVALSKL